MITTSNRMITTTIIMIMHLTATTTLTALGHITIPSSGPDTTGGVLSGTTAGMTITGGDTTAVITVHATFPLTGEAAMEGPSSRSGS